MVDLSYGVMSVMIWQSCPVVQERNELKAGTLVMHNSHPCATPLALITKQGLSWNEARTKLAPRNGMGWDAKPGEHQLCLH